jgi:hypothetical protein
LVFLASCQPDIVPANIGPTSVALFDPLASPAVVPQPTDLAFQGGDGMHLNVPIDPMSPPAQQAFNKYLNTLDGFPGTLDATTTFSTAIDPASATAPSAGKAGSVLVIDQKSSTVLQASEVTIKTSADGKTLIITPARRWQPGHHYTVALFGGQNNPSALKGVKGETVLASPAFFFLRSSTPLVVKCADGMPDCACPASVIASGMDPNMTCQPAALGLDEATALKSEQARVALAPAIDQALALSGGQSRANLALLWTFTITTSPVAIFDAARGDVPFPNDVLINQMTGQVNLPIAAGDPMAPIKMQLNQLDGFSTSAAETISVDTLDNLPPDAASLGTSALLLNVTQSTLNQQPTSVAAPALVMGGTVYTGQVAVQPTTALLSDQNRYAVVITNDAKDGAGRPFVPSPPFVLAKSPTPLFDGTHSLVPGLLDDATAQQLEQLRLAYQPLLAALSTAPFNIPTDKVAAVWTFTTQSINRPLLALDAFPTSAALSTAVTIDHVTSAADLAAAAGSLNYAVGNLSAVVFGHFQSKGVLGPTTGHIVFDRTTVMAGDPSKDTFAVHAPANAPATTIKFVLALPKSAAAGGAPVAIVQHGLTEWRGQGVLLADAFAAQGWATIAIDVDFHGARSICTANNQCVTSCDLTTHSCVGGFVPTPTSMDPFACTLQPLNPTDPDSCRPLVSGQGFVDPSDLFTSRDHLRQYVLDAAQLARVIGDPGAGGLQGQLAAQAPPLAINGTQTAFLGQSLGGILGTLYLSVAPTPKVAYLSTTGGHDFEELGAGIFHTIVDQYLQSIGVMKDTAAYLQVVSTARWALDPADPYAVGHNLIRLPPISYVTMARNPAKVVLQQESGMDMVIPGPFQEALALEIFGPTGLDAMHHVQSKQLDGTIVSTFWPTATHGSLFVPASSAAADINVTAALQLNAATWIATGGATITAVVTQ